MPYTPATPLRDSDKTKLLEIIPPSSIPSQVPQSAIRDFNTNSSISTSFSKSASYRQPSGVTPAIAVQATPTRQDVLNGHSQSDNFLRTDTFNYGDCLPSSPLAARHSNKNSTSDSWPIGRYDVDTYKFNIQSTPIKQKGETVELDCRSNFANASMVVENTKENTHGLESLDGGSALGVEESIYKSLGWDDMDDAL